MTPQHPIQRLYLAEELVRRRGADEHRRHVASQRSGRIDPNPHQIDAVIFALARLPEGGCILADEVGLGKTIEAGLVIAQVRAEGARRVLVVTPKALLGQWKQELFTLFGIDAREASRGEDGFAGEGVLLATRDLVGSEAGAARLGASPRFDLCVVDEAHEVFSGIYRRFDAGGAVRDDAPQARMAGRLSQALRDSGTPVLLLTATPMQNSLAELWGLVHYVDPSGTLLGDLGTFRQVFCPSDDRVLADGLEGELQGRLQVVLRRTLRRQAQEFMREPFMGRQARLFEYTMSPQERAVYDDVTAYLLQPSLYAFMGRQRTLLLLGFHRRMASSHAALSASLDRVAERLRRLLARVPPDEEGDGRAVLGDLEEDEAPAPDDDLPAPAADAGPAITAELERVESFARRARALPTDGKALALVRAVRLVFDQGAQGKSGGKVVVFTESLTTQEYLRSLLVGSGLCGDEEVTLFRGDNDGPRASQALRRWQEDVGDRLAPDSRPSPEVAVRLALVHEFRHRSKVFISTEAGAKGLNLQFCETVVNYDLPWNPQRIEQRIGRCHRYGQPRDVTVINFIARDNEAQRLTFDILSQKLELFGAVLGATDEVLHRPGPLASEALASALGGEFESQLRRIYERARTVAEVERELRALRDALGTRKEAFESAQRRTEEVIQRRLDDSVRQAFRRIQEELPRELEAFDRDVEGVVLAFLGAAAIPHQLERGGPGAPATLTVAPSPRLPAPLDQGTICVIGEPPPGATLSALHLGHPLVTAALAEVRAAAAARPWSVQLDARTPETLALRGQRGRLRLLLVSGRGFEATQHLVPVAVLEGGGAPLPADTTRALLLGQGGVTDRPGPPGPPPALSDAVLDDAVEELLFVEGDAGAGPDQSRFERTLLQLERFIGDRILVLEREKTAATAALLTAEAARDAAMGAQARTRADQGLRRAQAEGERVEAAIARLRAGDDEHYQRWRRHAQERRFAAPLVTPLLEAEFEIILTTRTRTRPRPGPDGVGAQDKDKDEDDVALKLLHTADWHLGRRFAGFDEPDRVKLSRARLEVIDRILLAAEQGNAHALLCAGDLFDEPAPERSWWEPLAAKLSAMPSPRPVFLLPGNHDPLQPGSVYDAGHPFRRALPAWVQVIDRDDFSAPLAEGAVLHARPCRSRAGQDDPALALPGRAPGDENIRIGMVHGSTFDAVDCQTNFPIARDAAARRGFDYLAIGDTHSHRNVPPDARPPVVYPGTPEPTTFGETDAGFVVAVFVSHSRRVSFRAEKVAYWTWAERTVRSLDELRALRAEPQLARTVLRLILEMRLTAPALEETERLLTELKGTPASHGRAGVLQLDRHGLSLDSTGIEALLTDLPEVLQATVARLRVLEGEGPEPEVARAALYHLYRLVREAHAR